MPSLPNLKILFLVKRRHLRTAPEVINFYKERLVGLTLASVLRWRDHVDNFIFRASMALGQVLLMRLHCYFFPPSPCYTDCIRPILEHGNVILAKLQSCLVDQLELFQRKAARLTLNRLLYQDKICHSALL